MRGSSGQLVGTAGRIENDSRFIFMIVREGGGGEKKGEGDAGHGLSRGKAE